MDDKTDKISDLEYPHISTGGKRYKAIVYQGDNPKYQGDKVRLYESGHIATWDDGRIIQPAAHTLMTRDSAIELNRRRRELAADRARAFVVSELAGVAGMDLDSFESAWGLLIGKLAASGLDNDQPLHARVKAIEAVGKAAGVNPGRSESGPGEDAAAGKFIEFLRVLRPYLAASLGRDNTGKHDLTDNADIIDM